MQTMQPTLRIGRIDWDKINMPKAEFQNRVKEIQNQMTRKEIDVLFLYGYAFNDDGNPCYISNYSIRLPNATLVAIPRDGEITLMIEAGTRTLPFARTMTWVEEIRAVGDISKECVKYLEDKNLIPSTVGFAGVRELMPYYQLQFLSESIAQCKIIDCSDVIKKMRMIKSTRECDQVHRSSRIVRSTFDAIFSDLLPGINEKYLEAIIYKEARLQGAQDIRLFFAKPQEKNWSLRPSEDLNISPGESIIIYLAVRFERYWAEGIRTFILNDEAAVFPQEVENVKALYQEIINEIKTGKTVSQFYKETFDKMQKSNVEYISDYGLGDGIGIGLQEFPALTAEETVAFTDRISFSLRLAVKDSEAGAIMLGNTILLAEEGPTVLTA